MRRCLMCTVLSLLLLGCNSPEPPASSNIPAASTPNNSTPPNNAPQSIPDGAAQSSGQPSAKEAAPPTDFTHFSGLSADDWIGATTEEPYVTIVPPHCKWRSDTDRVRFTNKQFRTYFKYKRVLRGDFVIRFVLACDQGPEGAFSDFQLAAGLASATKSQIQLVIPQTSTALDRQPHVHELSRRGSTTTFSFDGQKCQTLEHSLDEAFQFFFCAQCDIEFHLTEFKVGVHPNTLQPGIEPRAATESSGLRSRIFQSRPVLDGEVPHEVGGEITQVALGKEGQRLIVYNAGKKAIHVFDVPNRTLLKSIPVADSPHRIAVGRRDLVVYESREKQLTSWNLDTLEVQAKRQRTEQSEIEFLALGPASDRPLLVISRQSGAVVTVKPQFLNPSTLEELNVDLSLTGDLALDWGAVKRIRPSTDGKVFGIISGNHRYCVVVSGRVARIYADRHSGYGDGHRFAWPSERGGTVMADAEVIDTHLRRMTTSFPVLPATSPYYNYLIPSLTGPYFLTMSPIGFGTAQLGMSDCFVSVRVPESAEPILDLPDLDATVEVRTNWEGHMPPVERLHFLPQLNTVITIPPTNRHVVFRDVPNVDEHVRKTPTPYFFLEPQRLPLAIRGREFRHKFLVRTNQQLKWSLLEAQGIRLPEGMVLENDATLRWKVPADIPLGRLTTFQIHIAEANTLRLLLQPTFNIDVVDWPPEPNRKWTDAQSGKTVDAKLLQVEGPNIRVLRSDGREFTIPQSRLIAADQEYIADSVPSG